jgi:hypothetical protein
MAPTSTPRPRPASKIVYGHWRRTASCVRTAADLRSTEERAARPGPLGISAHQNLSRSFAIGITASRRRQIRKNPLVALAAALVTTTGLALYTFRPAAREPAPRIVPFTSLPGLKRQPAFSPEGNQIAFTWNGDQGEQYSIYVKLIEAGSPLRLTESPGVDASPAWSPDGRYIAFRRQSFSGDGYYVIPALGGQERKLASFFSVPFSWGRSLDWSPDGRSLAVVDRVSANVLLNLLLVPVAAGETRPLLQRPRPSCRTPCSLRTEPPWHSSRAQASWLRTSTWCPRRKVR